MKKFAIFLFLLVFFLTITYKVSAEGVQLSSTQVGSTVTYTAQIPPNPCVLFNLGSGATRTVVGFNYSAYGLDANGVMDGNDIVVDLSQSKVTQITIAGNTTSDFSLDPSYSQIYNAQDVKRQQVMYKLNSPITFTPTDTASITVENVKIVAAGKVKLVFALTEPTGTYCLESGYTTVTTGARVNNTVTNNNVIQVPTITKTLSTIPVPTISGRSTQIVVPTKAPNKEVMSNGSFFKVIVNFVKNLFHWL